MTCSTAANSFYSNCESSPLPLALTSLQGAEAEALHSTIVGVAQTTSTWSSTGNHSLPRRHTPISGPRTVISAFERCPRHWMPSLPMATIPRQTRTRSPLPGRTAPMDAGKATLGKRTASFRPLDMVSRMVHSTANTFSRSRHGRMQTTSRPTRHCPSLR